MEGFPNLTDALNEIGKKLTEEYKASARRSDLHASGDLENSFEHRVIKNKLEIYAKAYAGALDSGITNKADVISDDFQKKIIKWARYKGIRPRRISGKYGDQVRNKRTGQFASIKDYHYRQMGFLIARSIAKKGIIERYNYKGSGFMTEATKAFEEELNDTIANAVSKDLSDNLDNNIDK